MDGFSRLACGGCPPLADLMLSMAAEFRLVDEPAAEERLDDLARTLFGLDERTAASALVGEIGTFQAERLSVAGLWLDRVLEERAGHPLVLAAIAAEAGRRAGLAIHVLSTSTGWYAGLAGGERMWLIDTTMDGRRIDASHLRRHCSHEVAFAALLGLSERYERLGDARGAGRAALLRRQLPLLRRSH
jgi:regulator of sirC expression with transglutaminase-like and TPR domain